MIALCPDRERRIPRRAVAVAVLAVLSTLGPSLVQAGLPPPNRSSCGLSAPFLGCRYLFRADGGLDVMTVSVTLRDAFDSPVPGCETSVSIQLIGPAPGGGPCGYTPSPGAALCSCCPLTQTAVSDFDGTLEVTFSRLGGRGTAAVLVTALCVGAVEICREEFVFTSPDMDGTCEPSGTSTSIIDFGIWVACYAPNAPCITSDYNCDCVTSVLDVGVYAGGLGKNCGGAVCP